MHYQPPNEQSIGKQFNELNNLIANAIKDLSNSGNLQPAVMMQELMNVSRTIKNIEKGVQSHLEVRRSQLRALVGVGHVINSSLGLKRVLEEVMDTIIDLMRAERGFLMMRDPNGELAVQTARGIDHVNLNEAAFAFSRTIVNRVAESGEPVLTTNAQQDARFGNQMSVAAYQLRSILCVPLKLKNEIIGVIFVDNRGMTGLFQESDQDLLKAFADQAAVAIDNARLFEDLKSANFDLEAANLELAIAYDATLNGWVRALDLRDKETEGHTKRVTILTRRLAKTMGVDDDLLIHITRGALLHDIGKMAIPDGVLLKPGSLSSEERAMIEKHPVYAYEMLSPIEFLRPAIDIPYCHHEKWDGTGYPRKLKGEEIPFSARIFPVVDVWDALTSDRPYRKKLPVDEVRRKIADGSGSHFDPRAVEAFLNMSDISVSDKETI